MLLLPCSGRIAANEKCHGIKKGKCTLFLLLVIFLSAWFCRWTEESFSTHVYAFICSESLVEKEKETSFEVSFKMSPARFELTTF